MMIGPAAGNLIGGVLLEHAGWRALFIYAGIGGCVWLVPWALLMRGSHSVTIPMDRQVAPAAAEILRWPPFWLITPAAFLYAYFWYFCLTWLPSYFMVSRRFSPTRMGTFTAIPLILMAATSLLGGSLGDRLIAAGRDPVRVRAVLTAGGFLAGTSIALVPIFQSDLLAIATLCVPLSGVGIAAANYWAVTQTLLPRQFIGRAIGFQNMVANIGGASVPVVSGFLIGPSNDFFLPILFSAVSILIAAGAYLVLAGRSAALATAPTPSRAHGAH
jgi:ACS family D-galactonate transporter-like MFS transporter